jgi:hypothetical protein
MKMGPTYLVFGGERQFADGRVSVVWSSSCQEESLTQRYAEPTVTCQSEDGYIRGGRGEGSANGHRRQGGRGAIGLFGTDRMCARILLLKMRLRAGEMVVGKLGRHAAH